MSAFCFYDLRGSDSTPEGFAYAEQDFPNSQPIARSMGDGDEVFNWKILEICLKWAEEQDATFESRTFTSDHRRILLMVTCLLPFIKLSQYRKSVQPQKHPLRRRRKVGAGGDNMQMNLIAMQGFSTAAMYVRMHTLFL